MERYTVRTLKDVLNSLPSDGYLWGNENLVRLTFLGVLIMADLMYTFCVG